MNKMTKKSKVAVAIATAGMLSVGGAAFAYWTTTGAGSGSFAAAGSGGTIALHATFDSGIVPGTSKTVTYTADNGTATNTIVSALSAAVSTPTGCLQSWFTVTANPNTPNSTVAAGAHTVSVGTGTLTFIDDPAVDQSACKNALITVSVTSN